MEKRQGYRYAYCLFCKTGAENRLIEEIGKRMEEIRVLAGVQEKHKFSRGSYEIDRRAFLPGYLFVYAKEPVDFEKLLRMDDIYRILGDDAQAHELQGSDRAFADWFLRNDGRIGISRIRIEGGKVQAISGPMQYFAKKLLKIDKHTKNALVRMDFLGTEREMWLAFEFEDEETENMGGAGK